MLAAAVRTVVARSVGPPLGRRGTADRRDDQLVPIESEGSVGNNKAWPMPVGGFGGTRAHGGTGPVDSARRNRLPWRRRPGEMPGPSSSGRAHAPTRQRVAGALGRRCANAAEQIRSSTGVLHDECRGRRSALRDSPWPRLFLWMFACAALVVSLMIRADGLDHHGPGSTVHAEASERSWTSGLPLLGSILRSGGSGAASLTSGPEM